MNYRQSVGKLDFVATEVKTRGRGRPNEGARDALIDAATALFIAHDYADVSTDEILARAGVTRGALYHHFDGKMELFRAVYEASESRAVERIAQHVLDADGPFEALVAGALAYLRDVETADDLRRIGIMQSREVLGWERWRDSASKYGLAVAEATLGAAMDAGVIARRDLTTLSHVVIAALIEGAVLIATAQDPAAVRPEVEQVLVDLLEGLRV